MISRAWLVIALACGPAPLETPVVQPLPTAPAGSSLETPKAPANDEADIIIPITSDDPVWGLRGALVTIVQYTDIQCPFCAKAHQTLEQLRKDYGGDTLRIVFKHYPLQFHPEAMPAARASTAVFRLGGDRAFWTFEKRAFDHQSLLSKAMYEKWATEAGVNVQAFRAALDDEAVAHKVDADIEEAKRLGVAGTPHFFIDGKSFGGAQPVEKFHTEIDRAIADAKDRLAKGTPRDGLYRAAVATNYKPEVDEDAPDTTTVWKIPIAKSPTLGPATALVTIVEFGGFQDPFCKRAAETVKALRAKYGADLRVVWKNHPLAHHSQGEPSAELALEARAEKGDSGFFDAASKLFDSAPQLAEADLENVAKSAGIDWTKAKAAITTHKYKASIDADDDLADDFDVNGTPTFFINGRRMVGAVSQDDFVKIIDDELKKARALVAAGTKPDKVYDEVMKTGKEPPPPPTKKVPANPNAPSKGPQAATVTITEFGDFQDPYCKKVEDTLAEIAKAYPTKVRFVWRNFSLPMHPDAHLAAELGNEAMRQKGAAAFFKVHDAMFQHQTDPDALKLAQLEGYGTSSGLDAKQLHDALTTGRHVAEVDADGKAATDAGISGIPAFLINDYYLSGAQPFAKFRKLIDRAIADGQKKP